jgi:hypothetical protein
LTANGRIRKARERGLSEKKRRRKRVGSLLNSLAALLLSYLASRRRTRPRRPARYRSPSLKSSRALHTNPGAQHIPGAAGIANCAAFDTGAILACRRVTRHRCLRSHLVSAARPPLLENWNSETNQRASRARPTALGRARRRQQLFCLLSIVDRVLLPRCRSSVWSGGGFSPEFATDPGLESSWS